MTNLDRAKTIYSMMAEGKMLEAFDTYYHDDAIKVEGNGDVLKGKAANRETQVQWVESTEEVHGSGVTAMAEDSENGTVLIETWVDVTFKGGSRIKIEQVAVQKWENGLIVHERFYYNPSAMGM